MNQTPRQDLTDVDYWDRVWAGRPVPAPLDPRDTSLNNTVSRHFDRLFRRVFDRAGIGPGRSILEVGCGGSVMLPYFVKEFGLSAEGLENAPNGRELSVAIARKSDVHTPIHAADLFDVPGHLQERFDLVFSAGLVEHFRPPEPAIAKLAELAAPGGHVLTTIPNLTGVLGLLQRYVNRGIYDLHHPMSARRLAEAHSANGLAIVNFGYLMTVNFGVINAGESEHISASLCERLTSWASKSVWLLEKFGFPTLPNPVTSPYAFVLARKPD